MKKLHLATALAITIALLLFTIAQAYAASTDDSEGTVTVTSAVPSISNPELWDSGESQDKNNTALSVNTEYHVNFTVSDSNALGDLDNCTIIMWNNGGGTSEGDADSQQNHLTWTWTESTDTWAEAQSGGWWDYSANCKDPGTGSAETSFEFTLAFDLPKVANYSNGGAPYDGWTIKIYAYDDSEQSDSDDTLQFGVASYVEIAIVSGETTHTFSGTPGSTDNAVSAGGDAKIDVNVTTNAPFDVQVESLNATVQSVGTPTDEFNIGNVTHYGSNDAGSSVALTTNYADVTGLTGETPPTTEASPSTVGIYLWVDIPNGQPAHNDYKYTLRIQVVKA